MFDWTHVVELARNGNAAPPRRDERSDEEWREVLSDEQFYVTRQAGTERPFSSGLCSLFEPGLYGCACCGETLFDSNSKFESGTGWPSFGAPVAENVVAYHMDESHGMIRIEAVCAVCDAHLGHVFPDGPPPTGLRYCMNALSLDKQHG